MKIAISTDKINAALMAQAHALAEACKIPLWDNASGVDYLLELTADHLQLLDTRNPAFKPVFVDFLTGASRHRRLHGGGKRQHLAKAIGLNKHKNLSILDATAGLGGDAFVLASLGCDVTMLERALPVYLLLNDGLHRAKSSDDPQVQEIVSRMTLLHTAAQDYFQSIDADSKPDVIYLDPMFPQRGKSAKVKKEMTLFHGLVGKDEDAGILLQSALSLAEKRVAVKRPRRAGHLTGIEPAFQIIGKSTRYDIYLPETH